MAASRTAAFSAGFCRACARQDASTSSAARPGRCFRRRAAAAAAAAATAAAALTVTALPATAQAKGVLSTNTLFRRYVVTDGDAVLRYALPLPAERAGEDMPPIRRIQQLLEQLGIDVRARGAAGTFAARSSLARLRGTLDTERLDVLLGVPASKRAAVGDDLARLDRLVAALAAEITGGEAGSTPFPPQLMAVQGVLRDALAPRTAPLVFDPAEVDGLRRDALDIVADIENTMAAGEAFPYRVPRRYES